MSLRERERRIRPWRTRDLGQTESGGREDQVALNACVIRSHATSAGRFWLPALRHLQRHSQAWPSLLAQVGLTVTSIEAHEERVPLDQGLRLLRAGAHELRDPLFALHAGLAIDRASFPLIAFVATTQGTGRAAFQVASRLAPLTFDALCCELRRERGGQRDAQVTLQLSDGGSPFEDPNLAEYLVGSIFGVQQGAVEADLQRVEFGHRARAPLPAYRRALGAPVVFNQSACAFVYYAPSDARIVGADPVLSEVLSKQAFGLLSQLPTGAGHVERVRRLLLDNLASGPVTIDTVADALRMSQRTLRRRLAAEGVSYRQVLDGVRRERALVLVEQSDANLDQVALALGFSGAGAFRRAFQRWTGESPRAYRAKVAPAVS